MEKQLGPRPGLLRRKLLIDKKIQIPLLAHSLTIATIAITLTSTLVLVNSIALDWEQPGWLLFLIYASVATLAFLIMMLVGLYFTNRVAGPLYRLKRHMQDLTDGKPTEALNSREGDYTHELFQEYNRLVEKLKKPS